MHDIYKSNICKLVTQHIPHVQGELVTLQEHLIWFTVFNGVGVFFLCFLSFVVFVYRLLSLSLVCCLCLSFVVFVSRLLLSLSPSLSSCLLYFLRFVFLSCLWILCPSLIIWLFLWIDRCIGNIIWYVYTEQNYFKRI